MRWNKALLALPIIFTAAAGLAQSNKSSDAIVIVFKDGHQQTIPMSSISRIDFNSSTAAARPTSAAAGANTVSVNHFVGKWEVAQDTGLSSKFFITLNRDGSAKKTIGAANGKWEVVGNEAQITWDDGWHDAIRKVGGKHQKYAYGPGKSFSDQPDNVTNARNLDPNPI
jgi:hypothetical protein